MDPIDQLVLVTVAGRLAFPSDAADLVTPTAAGEVDVAALRDEAKQLRARLDMLTEMLTEGDLDRAAYRTAKTKVRAKLEEAEAAIASAARRSPLAPLLTAADPPAAFLAADVEVQRSAIRELVTISLHRTGPGRKPFNPDTVRIAWRER